MKHSTEPTSTLPTETIRLKNVMCATDFSAAANAAFPYAAEFARRFGANFYAVHVRSPEEYLLAPTQSRSEVDAVFENEETSLRKVLRNDLPHLKTDVLSLRGLVWPMLKSAIQDKRIDLLVLGTRGRGGLGKLLLGFGRGRNCPAGTVSRTHGRAAHPWGSSFCRYRFRNSVRNGLKPRPPRLRL